MYVASSGGVSDGDLVEHASPRYRWLVGPAIHLEHIDDLCVDSFVPVAPESGSFLTVGITVVGVCRPVLDSINSP